jgi:hypothetical protein
MSAVDKSVFSQFSSKAIEEFMATLGLGPLAKPYVRKTYQCPECQQHNAYIKEAHEDCVGGMDEMVLRCPDCGADSDTRSIHSQVEGPKDSLAPWMYVNPTSPNPAIKPGVKYKLLKIAEKVRENLPIEGMPWEDVQIVGSSLGYNYTDSSDVDLHFIVDLEGFAEKHSLKDKEEARDLLGYIFKYMSSRGLYDIESHPVELYWQDKRETNYTPAIFSLVKDVFIQHPTKDTGFDENTLNKAKKRAKQLSELLDELIIHNDLSGIREWKDFVKDFRQKGLEKDGIYSYGNLMFKFLRSWDDLQKASDYIDKTLS